MTRESTAAAVTVVSFGYGHGDPPAANLTIDVRGHFRDPHVDPAFRNLTAADEQVVRTVVDTPGVLELIAGTMIAVHAYRLAPGQAPVTVAVGCVGGRHRSAVIAAVIAGRLRDLGVSVTLTHRDIGRPVLRSPRGARFPGQFVL